MLDTISHYDVCKSLSVQAFTDSFVYDCFDNLFLVSITGIDSTVKAISGALVEKRDISIDTQNLWRLSLSRSHKYKIFSVKLSCGALHRLVCSEELIKGKTMIYVPDDLRQHIALYDKVASNFAVPMLKKWSYWLYKKLKDDNAITELSGRPKILQYDFSESYLDELISTGVKNKEISF